MAHSVVGIGEALWDLLPSGRHLGGAPLNFCCVASQLGEWAIIASRIGADELGRSLTQELQRRKLETSHLQMDPTLPTGTVSVTVLDGQPDYEIHEPVAWDALEWTDDWQRLARSADAVCFGTLAQRSPTSRETIGRFLQNTRPDCLRVFDINLRQKFYSRELIEQSLELATVAKLNEAELGELATMLALDGRRGQSGLGGRNSLNEKTIEFQLQELICRYGLILVCLTRGERGSVLASADRVIGHPGIKVQVKDTIGAGDAFTAAVTHGLLNKCTLEEISERANRWAAEAISNKQ
ncbi:MAG TPA: carbohydrate kinase [Terriglobales bacterium]|nr:carbohydrate kinase [Terriglobales bacterium]